MRNEAYNVIGKLPIEEVQFINVSKQPRELVIIIENLGSDTRSLITLQKDSLSQKIAKRYSTPVSHLYNVTQISDIGLFRFDYFLNDMDRFAAQSGRC